MVTKLALLGSAAVALLLSGCACGVGGGGCPPPYPVNATGPAVAAPACRPNVSRVWSASNTYNAPDFTTCKTYY